MYRFDNSWWRPLVILSEFSTISNAGFNLFFRLIYEEELRGAPDHSGCEINVSWTNVAVVLQPISNLVKTYSWWNQRWLEDPRRYVPGNPRSAVKKYVLSPRSKLHTPGYNVSGILELCRGGGGGKELWTICRCAF